MCARMSPCAHIHANSLWYSAYARRQKPDATISVAREHIAVITGNLMLITIMYSLVHPHIRCPTKTPILYNFNALFGIYGRFHVVGIKTMCWRMCFECWCISILVGNRCSLVFGTLFLGARKYLRYMEIKMYRLIYKLFVKVREWKWWCVWCVWPNSIWVYHKRQKWLNTP